MSYASDLRAAAEAERDHPSAYNLAERVTLTTPDRLLPFLSYVEQLERVAEAARWWRASWCVPLSGPALSAETRDRDDRATDALKAALDALAVQPNGADAPTERKES